MSTSLGASGFIATSMLIVGGAQFFLTTAVVPLLPSISLWADAVIDTVMLTIGSGVLIWFIVVVGYRRAVSEGWLAVEAREAALLEETERMSFDSRLQDGLAIAESEAEVFEVAVASFIEAVPGVTAELALADSSHARFRERVRHGDAVGCAVSSPDACPAVRSHRPLRFECNSGMGVCSRLRNLETPCSAMCIPVSVLGRAAGVIQVIGPVDALPDAHASRALHVVSASVGGRVGTIRALQQIQRQAATDTLTGVSNRRAITERIEQLLSGTQPFALSIADLDRFKTINDVHGHNVGDRALCSFTQTASDVVGADNVGRWGGDEIVLILEGVVGEDAVQVAERIRARVEALRDASIPHITATFGVTDRVSGDRVDLMVRRADDALYDGKRDGRNRVCGWTQERSVADRRAAAAKPEPELMNRA